MKNTIKMIKNQINSIQQLTERTSQSIRTSSSMKNMLYFQYETPSLTIQRNHKPLTEREHSRTITQDKYSSYSINRLPINYQSQKNSTLTTNYDNGMCNDGSEKLILSNKNMGNVTRNNNYYYYHELKNNSCSISKNRNLNYTNYDYSSIRMDDENDKDNYNNIKTKTQNYCTMKRNYSLKNYTSNTLNMKKPKNNEKEYCIFKNNSHNDDAITMSKQNSFFNYIFDKKQLNKPIDSNYKKTNRVSYNNTKQNKETINYNLLLKEIRSIYNNTLALKEKINKSSQNASNVDKYNQDLFKIYKRSCNYFNNTNKDDVYIDICKWIHNSKNKIIYYKREVSLYKELFGKLLTVCNVNELNEISEFAQDQFDFISCGDNVKRTVIKMIQNNYLNNETSENVDNEFF